MKGIFLLLVVCNVVFAASSYDKKLVQTPQNGLIKTVEMVSNGSLLKLEYDSQNRVVKVISDDENQAYTYTYESNRIIRYDKNGLYDVFNLDENGRISSFQTGYTLDRLETKEDYVYNSNNELIEIGDVILKWDNDNITEITNMSVGGGIHLHFTYTDYAYCMAGMYSGYYGHKGFDTYLFSQGNMGKTPKNLVKTVKSDSGEIVFSYKFENGSIIEMSPTDANMYPSFKFTYK